MRPIDADELRNRCEIIADSAEWFNHEQTTWMEAAKIFADMVDEAPTIDAAPVRRGEWERYNLTALGTGIEWYRLRCSECKLMPVGDVRNWNFCPNCGADMRKEEHHEPED